MSTNETDIERIERALSGLDETSPEQLPWLQTSATLEIALQIAKLRSDLAAVTNCVSGGRFDVQVYETGSGQ